MIITIPLRNDIFFYSFTKELENINYLFTIRLNARLGNWLMSVDDVLLNSPMLGGQDILGQFHHLEVPEGELRMVDLDGANLEPTRISLGDRLILQYTEP